MHAPFIAAALAALGIAAQREPETARRAQAPPQERPTGVEDPAALPLLSWALALVDDAVESPRIEPKALVAAALAAVEAKVSGVAVRSDAASRKVTVAVGSAIESFDMSRVTDTRDVRVVLGDAIAFVREKTQKSPLEIEYAAVSGILTTLDPHRARTDDGQPGRALGRALLEEWRLTASRAEKVRRMQGLFGETLSLVGKDTYAAYVDAGKRCEEILRLDPDSFAGHVFLAYVYAIRAGEHGDATTPEALRQVEQAEALLPLVHSRAAASARNMLEAGEVGAARATLDADRRVGRHSHLVAAKAFLRLSSGDAAGARRFVEAALDSDGPAQSPFLLGVLGTIRMREGDLDAASAVLARAHRYYPGDVRITWLLAEAGRRRGRGHESEAIDLYGRALEINGDHVGSMLGQALVWLDRGEAEKAERAAQLALDPRARASQPQQALARAALARALAAQRKTTGRE